MDCSLQLWSMIHLKTCIQLQKGDIWSFHELKQSINSVYNLCDQRDEHEHIYETELHSFQIIIKIINGGYKIM